MNTLYLIRKQGKYGVCDKHELGAQITNYGAEFIGAFNHLSQNEVQKRYKRIIAIASKTGYYAPFEVRYFIWAYLWHRNAHNLEIAHQFLKRFMDKISRRHELKKLGLL